VLLERREWRALTKGLNPTHQMLSHPNPGRNPWLECMGGSWERGLKLGRCL
jgi:hypothetical protein